MTFRKIVLLCLLLSFDVLLYAQEDGQYKLSISFSSIQNTGNTMKSTEYRVSGISEAGKEEYHHWNT